MKQYTKNQLDFIFWIKLNEGICYGKEKFNIKCRISSCPCYERECTSLSAYEKVLKIISSLPKEVLFDRLL